MSIKKIISPLFVATMGFIIHSQCFANDTIITKVGSAHNEFKPNNLTLQLGWVNFYQSGTQHVNLMGVIGDDFTTTSSNTSNGLVGIGYYPLKQSFRYYDLSFGVNAFYLGHTLVSGDVTQENLFTNLAYSYALTNWPIYFGVKTDIHNSDNNYNVTFDAGIGPNVVVTDNFSESPLNDYTLPDYIFSGQTSTSFTAMAGIGVKFNHVLGAHPIECGYRFMYLGPADLKAVSPLVLSNLNTGHNYANAVLCGISF